MSRKLRIGVACFATYGGSGVVATELGREMARAGHKVHFISNQLPFRLNQGEFLENVYYHEATSIAYDALPSPMYGFEIASKVIQIALEEKLDLLHAHYAVPHAISGIMAKQVLQPRGLKIVTTLHGTDIMLVGKTPELFPLTKWSIEQSDAVTTVSGWLREETRKTFDVDVPIHVINNFVDTKRFNGNAGPCFKDHFTKAGEKILLHVSNFRPVKRLQDVIKVFAEVQKVVPSKLLLIGDGPERERAFQTARELGVMDKTFFLGKQNMIEHYYSISDLLVFPSEYESFGVTALEAMSSRLPVVASVGSGLSEVVEDGKTGFLRPVGDIEGMAKASIEILTNPKLHRWMGELGRERAMNCFQASRITQQYLDLYESVVNGGSYAPVERPCDGGEAAEEPVARPA